MSWLEEESRERERERGILETGSNSIGMAAVRSTGHMLPPPTKDGTPEGKAGKGRNMNFSYSGPFGRCSSTHWHLPWIAESDSAVKPPTGRAPGEKKEREGERNGEREREATPLQRSHCGLFSMWAHRGKDVMS